MAISKETNEIRNLLLPYISRLSIIKRNQLNAELRFIKPEIINHKHNTIKLNLIDDESKQLIIDFSERLFSEPNYENYYEIHESYYHRIINTDFVFDIIMSINDKKFFYESVPNTNTKTYNNINYIMYRFEQIFGITIDGMIESYHQIIKENDIKYSTQKRIRSNEGYYVKQFIHTRLKHHFNNTDLNKLTEIIEQQSNHLLTNDEFKFSTDYINDLCYNDLITLLNYVVTIKPLKRNKNE